MTTFVYDRFQQEAMHHIDNNHSVLVSAPTGAGKTVIAEYAIEQVMRNRAEAIYTAPIKALSNQKFRDFRARYGESAVGILTGDVSLNPTAPILIMTTEIYRNTLFDNPERFKNVSWVIFDEIHYLDDLERGTVWEESIMFTPEHIKFIGLSATVPNIAEFAEWIESIHHRPLAVVIEDHRPVPLEHRFQCQGQLFNAFKALEREGFPRGADRPPRGKHYGRRFHDHRRDAYVKLRPNRLDHLLSHLQDAHELPCIYFVFSRARAQLLADEAAHFNFLAAEEEEPTRELFWSLCEKYNLTEERSARELSDLVRRGIGYHHAGMLPTLKEVIEQLFTAKALKLIFTTETFALGINMPARSVVFDELRKFYGTHFGNLRTRDYYQMAGRAGRRGMDKAGFVYSRVNPRYISAPEIQRIIFSKPEAVSSQFNATYATVLNLYRTFKRKLLEMYPRSFHAFQSSKRQRQAGYSLLDQKLRLLETLKYIEQESLTAKGEFASSLYGYELTLSEMHADGFLEHLNEYELGMVLVGLVFEPRKGDELGRLEKRTVQLMRQAESYHRYIIKAEHKFRVWPFSKACAFHLAPALEAWMRGTTFDELLDIVTIDEGEIVRYFRMVIQLLRQIRTAHGAPESLQVTARKAIELINKDIIDAEKQLRV